MTLKERIVKHCKLNNIPVSRLEKELGFAGGYISKLDKSMPNSSKLQKIADYFNVSLDYLMTGEDSSSHKFSAETATLVGKIRNDTELSKALQKYFDLSDAKKKHVIEIINLLSEVQQ